MTFVDPSHAESAAERALRLSVAAVSQRTSVDPLFRRRLRGRVLNSYVAAREGSVRPVTRPRKVGTIGRASLFASIALMLSVGGAMAASGASIPGDLFYPMKRQLEEVRQAVLPAHFHDELAAAAFAQRVHELARLMEAGDVARAAALLPDVRASYEVLAALSSGADDDFTLSRQLSVLADLLEQLPEPAANAIERAMRQAPGLTITDPPGGGATELPPATDGPEREPRPARERSGPPEPSTGGGGGGDGRPVETPTERRGPDEPSEPDARSSQKPELGEETETKGGSD